MQERQTHLDAFIPLAHHSYQPMYISSTIVYEAGKPSVCLSVCIFGVT